MNKLIYLLGVTVLGLSIGGCGTTKQQASEPAVAAPKDPAPAAARGLVFHTQPGWTAETPTSTMRKAQYVLPRADGDEKDAQLVVYFFAGAGGSKEANIERWKGQFEGANASTDVELAQSNQQNPNGLAVLDVAVSGTYVAETAPGSGVRVREAGWRMLASIVDTPDGPYYLKLVGPGRTVEKWSRSYRAFVAGLSFVE